MFKTDSTQAEVIKTEPRKENSDDGEKLASFVELVFSVPRETFERLVPTAGSKFIDMFYQGDEPRLESLYPITYGFKVPNLRLTLVIAGKPMEFEGAQIVKGMKFTPQAGGFLKCHCKVKLYPTMLQSGQLDMAVKEFIDITFAPMNLDLLEEANTEAA